MTGISGCRDPLTPRPQYIERLSSERNPHTAQRTAGMHAIDAGGTRTREHFDFMRADQRDRWAWRTVADRQGRIKAGDVGATVVHRAIEVNRLAQELMHKSAGGFGVQLVGDVHLLDSSRTQHG